MYEIRKRLPQPTTCDNCNGPNVIRTTNDVVYGELAGDWPYCYYCNDCAAMTGCHPNTHIPLGLMATGAIRRRRGKLHEIFDPIWKLNYLSREDAYTWLGTQLELNEECHISHLSKEQLKQAFAIVLAHKKNDYALFKRRKDKNAAKSLARKRRQDSKIGIRKAGKPY